MVKSNATWLREHSSPVAVIFTPFSSYRTVSWMVAVVSKTGNAFCGAEEVSSTASLSGSWAAVSLEMELEEGPGSEELDSVGLQAARASSKTAYQQQSNGFFHTRYLLENMWDVTLHRFTISRCTP